MHLQTHTHAHKLALDMCMTFGRQETFDKTHRNFIAKFLKLLNDGIYCRWGKEKGKGEVQWGGCGQIANCIV